jgi:hypothetical protein
LYAGLLSALAMFIKAPEPQAGHDIAAAAIISQSRHRLA